MADSTILIIVTCIFGVIILGSIYHETIIEKFKFEYFLMTVFLLLCFFIVCKFMSNMEISQSVNYSNEGKISNILSMTDSAIERIYNVITVTGVFVTVLIATAGIFQFFKIKELGSFKKEYEQELKLLNKQLKVQKNLLIADRNYTIGNIDIAKNNYEALFDEKLDDLKEDIVYKLANCYYLLSKRNEYDYLLGKKYINKALDLLNNNEFNYIDISELLGKCYHFKGLYLEEESIEKSKEDYSKARMHLKYVRSEDGIKVKIECLKKLNDLNKNDNEKFELIKEMIDLNKNIEKKCNLDDQKIELIRIKIRSKDDLTKYREIIDELLNLSLLDDVAEGVDKVDYEEFIEKILMEKIDEFTEKKHYSILSKCGYLLEACLDLSNSECELLVEFSNKIGVNVESLIEMIEIYNE